MGADQWLPEWPGYWVVPVSGLAILAVYNYLRNNLRGAALSFMVPGIIASGITAYYLGRSSSIVLAVVVAAITTLTAFSFYALCTRRRFVDAVLALAATVVITTVTYLTADTLPKYYRTDPFKTPGTREFKILLRGIRPIPYPKDQNNGGSKNRDEQREVPTPKETSPPKEASSPKSAPSTKTNEHRSVILPEARTPETQLPRIKLPRTRLPRTRLPRTNLSETRFPGTETPELRLSGHKPLRDDMTLLPRTKSLSE